MTEESDFGSFEDASQDCKPHVQPEQQPIDQQNINDTQSPHIQPDLELHNAPVEQGNPVLEEKKLDSEQSDIPRAQQEAETGYASDIESMSPEIYSTSTPDMQYEQQNDSDTKSDYTDHNDRAKEASDSQDELNAEKAETLEIVEDVTDHEIYIDKDGYESDAEDERTSQLKSPISEDPEFSDTDDIDRTTDEPDDMNYDLKAEYDSTEMKDDGFEVLATHPQIDRVDEEDFDDDTFQGANFEGAEFEDAPLENIDADFEADFDDSTFQAASFGAVDDDFQDVNFDEDFGQDALQQPEAVKKDFDEDDDFRDPDFGDADEDFQGVDFGDADEDFQGVDFGDADEDFQGVDFGDADEDFQGVDFGDADEDFQDVDFGDADNSFDDDAFEGASFQESQTASLNDVSSQINPSSQEKFDFEGILSRCRKAQSGFLDGTIDPVIYELYRAFESSFWKFEEKIDDPPDLIDAQSVQQEILGICEDTVSETMFSFCTQFLDLDRIGAMDIGPYLQLQGSFQWTDSYLEANLFAGFDLSVSEARRVKPLYRNPPNSIHRASRVSSNSSPKLSHASQHNDSTNESQFEAASFDEKEYPSFDEKDSEGSSNSIREIVKMSESAVAISEKTRNDVEFKDDVSRERKSSSATKTESVEAVADIFDLFGQPSTSTGAYQEVDIDLFGTIQSEASLGEVNEFISNLPDTSFMLESDITVESELRNIV